MFTFAFVSKDYNDTTPPFVFDDFCDSVAALEFAECLLAAHGEHQAIDVAHDGVKIARVERTEAA